MTVIRQPIMSGHCNFPCTADPDASHAKCRGGNTANPRREFQPCPCPCHYPVSEFECGNCGEALTEATHWPLDYEDSDEGEIRYVHIDRHTGRITGEECG